ncbi:MAG TPA: hypothetical protein VEI97_13105, partial [bacterium]|nr:hypothetical protein [bacterium]
MGVEMQDPYAWLDEATNEAFQWQRCEREKTEDYFSALPAFGTMYESYAMSSPSLKIYGVSAAGGQTYWGQYESQLAMMEFLTSPTGIDVEEGTRLAVLQLEPIRCSLYASPDGSACAVVTPADQGPSAVDIFRRDGTPVPGVGRKVRHGSPIAWLPDSSGFCYLRPQQEEGPSRAFQVTLATAAETELPFRAHRIFASTDGAALVISQWRTGRGSDLAVAPMRGNQVGTPVDIVQNIRWAGDASGDQIFWCDKEREGPGFVVQTATLENPRSHRDLFAFTRGTLVDLEAIGASIVVEALVDGAAALYVYDHLGQDQRELVLPGPGSIQYFTADGPGHALVVFNSPVHECTVLRYDLESGRGTTVYQDTSTLDPALYSCTREWAIADDGTRIPMFVVQRGGS